MRGLIVAWLVAAAPLCLLGVGLLPAAWANRRPVLMAHIAVAAAWTAFAAAVLAATSLIGEHGIDYVFVAVSAQLALGTYFDTLTAIMLLLVSFVGAIVTGYARNYLGGDPQQGRFFKWLALTLAAVMTLIASGNLLLFASAWVATSLCLHQLLVFYADRPAARLAARKKFIVSRLGDACLIGAIWLIYQAFGTFEFSAVFATAQTIASTGPTPIQAESLPWIAVLLVGAALLKSAQFPFHVWLPEVMETPTPVSALLHAGIINAGGFLIVRLSDIVSLSTPSLDMLAVVGGFTALFGSVVMLTQTSVKVSLAWSTVAQMGFMLLQCGLGAFSAAVLHIVAHSLYKAHAFLASGSVIDLVRAAWVPNVGSRPHPLGLGLAVGAAVAVTFAVGTAFGASLTQAPGVFALGAVLLMGLVHLIASAIDERPTARVVGRVVVLAVAVATTYFALQLAAEHLLAEALPPNQALRGPLDLAIVGLVVLSFAAVTVMQNLMPYRIAQRRWQALYVHLFNGLYVNALANRLVGGIWPIRGKHPRQGTQA